MNLADLLALDPIRFEQLVARLFESMSYAVEYTRQSGDEGVDLRLRRGEEVAIAQCKRYSGSVGQPQVRDFYGAMHHEKAVRGYLVTSGTFSLAVTTWARGKPIVLVDGPDLLAAIENAAIAVPMPTPEEREPSTEGARLLETVRLAFVTPRELGRILIEGPPPSGRRYEEVAEYLGRCLNPRGRTVPVWFVEGHRLRGRNRNVSLAEDGILFVDDFDGASTIAREELLDAHLQGYFQGAYGRLKRENCVLICTRWERRLPKSLLSKFSTLIRVADVEWEAIPSLEEWKRKDEEKREDARRRKLIRREKARSQKLIRQKEMLQEEGARLRLLNGLFCGRCGEWHPTDLPKSRCSKCNSWLRHEESSGHSTRRAGIFRTSWETSSPEEVARAKELYVQEYLAGRDSPPDPPPNT